MSKTFRQGQILEIIRKQQIFTQDELREELAKRGIAASQETLSRDLKELRLVKTIRGYMETPPQEVEPQFARMASEFLMDVKVAQNLVILRTGPGHANSVATALDAENWPDIVGSLAGDDTILVIAADAPGAIGLQNKFLEFLLEKSST